MDSKEVIQFPWAFDEENVLAAVQGSRTGLTEQLVQEKVEKYGPNVLRAKDTIPWYMLLLQQFANPLVYMLIGAAGVKFIFKGPVDAAVIGAVLFFMAVIGFVQEFKAQKAMTALLKLSAPKTKTSRGGTIVSIPADELVPGDILIVDAGDRIAADARLIETVNLKINEAAFTGESMPVEKECTIVPQDAPIHDRKNMVFMGTTVSSGRATAVVTSTGMNTEIGRIAEAIQETKKEKTPLQQTVDKLGHTLIFVVLGSCIMLVIVGLLQGIEVGDVLLLGVAAAVSGIPEGLPAAVTVVLSICVNRMAGRNVIIRKLTAVETLGSTTIICTDKTGTLTLNQMTVKNIWISGCIIDINGSGYEPRGDFVREGRTIDPQKDTDLQRILKVAALCNSAILNGADSNWNIIGDPTEGALLSAAGKAGLYKGELEKDHPLLEEIPFESEKQYMATLHFESGKRVAFVKGSLERLLEMSAFIKTNGGEQILDDSHRNAVIKANESMAAKALRVLAIAVAPYPDEFSKLEYKHLAHRLTLLGLIGMIDPPREEARLAVGSCKNAGIRVAMITGDNPLTASAIAVQLGISKEGDKAITGREIEVMNDDQLLVGCRTHNVYARIEPLHKLRIVQSFKRDSYITAMTGDGVNDAPALESANIGVSMGITGTDVAKEASDMILADDNFASIIAAVEEGRIVFNRLRNVVFFLLMTSATELFLLFLSVAFFGESPLEPIQILWINLITGALVAIPLGLEPGTGKELNQPPRDIHVGLIYPGMVIRLASIALLTSIVITWIFHYAPLPPENVAAAHQVRQTISFTSIVVFEWFFAFHARSAENGILKIGLFRNPWLLYSMILGLGLQIVAVYMPVMNRIFHTRSLTPVELLWVLFPGIFIVTLESIRKSIAPELFGLGKLKPVH
ncbi:MAG TPA: HAD-IC family P-type ATPase [Chitinispirillaceae bacterium]|nr:HAD-IC family P-type ATPase [Chitinispirillaceae bacterium]